MANQTYGRGQPPRQPQRPQQSQQQRPQPQQQRTPPPAGAGNQAPVMFDPGKQKVFEKFGDKFGLDPEAMVQTLKATCFRGQKADAPPITNEQLAMLLIVADQYNLNPFTKEIYAYPDKNGGIVAVVSIDGWIRIINEHEQFDGMQIVESENVVQDQSTSKYKHKPCFEWMECTIFRKDRQHHQPITEYFDEVYRPALYLKNNAGEWYEVATPWQSHTKRMMRHKTIIQAGRVTFGFAGIYDEDEAQRILEADDSVVATVERPATHVDAARDALRRRQQEPMGQASAHPQQPRPQSEAGMASTSARPAQTASAKAGASTGHNPWDEPPPETETQAKGWPPITEKERWVSLMLTEKDPAALKEAWSAYVDGCEVAGLEELDLDVESTYQFRAEELQPKK